MPSTNHTKYYQGTEQLMAEHGIPFQGANDVMYLRKQGLRENSLEERELIDAYKQGEKPNVLDYLK